VKIIFPPMGSGRSSRVCAGYIFTQISG